MDVLKLAELGWHLIAMQRGSKNPGSLVGEGWPSKCTNDKTTIQTWADLGLNFGVLLGSLSGVIDVEYDSEEGQDLLEHACEGIETLAYKSAKSVHRIFLWDDRFAFEKAKVGIRGTEWRFGQNGAQSVIPPSIHPDGPGYEWVCTKAPIRMPDSLWNLFCGLKESHERKTSRESPSVIAPRDRTGDSIIDLARAEAEKQDWVSLLSSRGWTFVRNRGDAQDWHRPGKKAGSISATVNYGGSGTLRVFSTSCSPLDADSSYDKFAFQCVLDYEDDPMKAAKAILPEETQRQLLAKWLESKKPAVDSSLYLDRDPDTDDEEFCEAMIPESGLLRDVASYVSRSSYKPSPVFSLATSISFCQTIFGRKAKSETGLRTNDFHLILAPTSAGKEGPLEAMTNLLGSVNAESYIMPGSLTGATALLDCLEEHPHHIQNWVCDEFGYVLSVMLDKKARDPHAKGLAKKMLELYGCSKRKYTGGAKAGKVRKHAMIQPHLCALGVSTGFTVFKEVSEDQVHDGLLGRISFWSLQRRPRPNRKLRTEVPEELKTRIASWLEFSPPPGEQNMAPNPIELPFSSDARARWEQHEDAILEKMEQERAIRAALWGRTAARSMKLALTHRLARIPNVAELNEFSQIKIELEDVNWGIAVSNHCTKLACSMIRESVTDTSGNRLSEKVLAIVKNAGDGISKAELKSRLKTADAGAIWAAVTELEAAKALRTWTEPTNGRPKQMVGVIMGNNLVQI